MKEQAEMTEQKHLPVVTKEDLMFFLDFANRRLEMLDEKELETRRRLLHLEMKDQQDGWYSFTFEEREEWGWRESMIRLPSMTRRNQKRASPLLRQTKAYARLEKLRDDISTRIERHLRMMDRLLEERGL
jgi:hypothetical protein